jgi:flagellar basal-body rod modification protein FlgD
MSVQSTISEIQSAGATAQQQAASKDSTTLGKDDFLKLLTTQLQQQDPTQPMDNTAFVAQLAQFSSLEQMNNVNDTLTKMLTAQGTAQQTAASSLIGKSVVFNTDEVALVEGDTATIKADLSAPAATVTITIQDSTGATVSTIKNGACQSGPNRFQWDGCDNDGKPLPTGVYTTTVQATDLEGNFVPLTVSGSARITGVTFTDGTPQFIAGGTTLQLSDISELDE